MYNPGITCNVLIFFDDTITDMIINKNLNEIVTELFTRGRKLNISTAFITQLYCQYKKMLDETAHIFLL